MITDSSWVRQGNLLPRNAFNPEDTYYRNYTSAYYKFTDTTLGGNFAMNPPPQFCDNADPVAPRFMDLLSREKDMPYSPGMGRWYSEKIDDPANLLHIRFGIPVYNSLTSFFGNFYNADDSRLVRTGRAWSIGSFIGKALGWAFSLRMLPFILIGSTLKFFAGTTSTRFMYLKPMMGTYWKYVNDFANTVAANMELTAGSSSSWMKFAEQAGLTPGNSGKLDYEKVKSAADDAFRIAGDERDMYAKMLPDIYKTKDGKGNVLTGIDIYSVATRAQRLANAFNEGVNRVAQANQGNANGVISSIRKWMNGGAVSEVAQNSTITYATTEDFLNAYYNGVDGKLNANATQATDGSGEEGVQTTVAAPVAAATSAQANTDPSNNPENNSASPTEQAAMQAQGGGEQSFLVSAYETVSDYFGSIADVDSAYATFKGAQRDGSMWVTFRIDGRPSVSESFSNSARDSTLASAFNSTSASNRNMRNAFADGSIINIPGMETVVNFVKDAASSFAQSMQIAGLGALAGNAFVDIPKHYDESSASFQEMSFDLQLRAPYGNDLSRFQCEILPAIMLLAGGLPRSTGTQSYNAPFLCEWYCRGRGQCRLGMIKDIQITRGVTNAPWSSDGKYRGVDIRVTIMDLSSVMHMPMNEVSGWHVIDPTSWNKLLFPQDSSFSDYTAVLASCGLSEQVYKVEKLKRNWYANMSSFDKWFSVSSRVSATFDGNRGMLLSALSKGDRG